MTNSGPDDGGQTKWAEPKPLESVELKTSDPEPVKLKTVSTASSELSVIDDYTALSELVVAAGEQLTEKEAGANRANLPADSSTDWKELPDMPRLATGIITAALSLLALMLIPSEIALNAARATMQSFNIFGSVAFLAAVFFFVMHLVWFYFSQKQLLKHTAQYFPQCNTEGGGQALLRTLLPITWLTSLVLIFEQCRIFGGFPQIQMAPLVLAFTVGFFIYSSFYWPSKLKALCPPKGEREFPHKIAAFGFAPFMAVPYIYYWRKALMALAPQQPAKAAKKVAALPRTRDKMVIRYRPFIAIERWFQHRQKSTSSSERLRNAVIAVTADAVLIVLLVIFGPALLTQMLQLFSPLGGATDAAAAASGGLNLFSNQIYLGFLALMATTLSAVATAFVLKHPTHFEFTPIGFKACRWIGHKKYESAAVAWNSLDSIKLNTRKNKGQVTALELEFLLDAGSSVKLNLGAVESVEDREIILQAIERWAPQVSRQAEVMQALQPPVDHSYTELWLQALSAPPQRDRLKPLATDLVLNDGRYKIKKTLGVGGQGAAYQSLDQGTGEIVVLKEFLLPIYVDISVRKDVLESFESEARILKHLNHDQVVKLLDFFVEDHRAYLVLEHIDGLSLREIVTKNGPLSEERVSELAKQMCVILNYLHSQEPHVVHRDFTPENLILRHDGLLKLIDFNVARQVESNATGSVVGKPAYLPPEQFRGQPVPQSDIYGMGATLSFLLTGKEPEPISASHPKEITDSVSQAMDDIVAKATAINLKERYDDCHQILQDLSDARAGADE